MRRAMVFEEEFAGAQCSGAPADIVVSIHRLCCDYREVSGDRFYRVVRVGNTFCEKCFLHSRCSTGTAIGQ